MKVTLPADLRVENAAPLDGDAIRNRTEYVNSLIQMRGDFDALEADDSESPSEANALMYLAAMARMMATILALQKEIADHQCDYQLPAELREKL